MKLDILSDPVCPWCYIGKALLDRALTERPDHPFDIEWHPFQLNPDMEAGGRDRAAHLAEKLGGPDRAAEIQAQIDARAAEAGLTIDWAAITVTPNTLDAHRLIHWAGLDGRQGMVVDRLFAAYFRQGRDIGDPDVLADIAEDAGMDRAMVARLLATDADAESIRARDAHARDRGVTGVPTFIVGERQAVPGAQPAELWLDVIAEITGQGAPQPGTVTGDAPGANGPTQ
ncbi:DsbA family oxidoreductase [Mesobaculum littorinae]|uniref:DsbA family oxidoreductase n=1 Tax=Mesobaculum littorinae TaxID=2486419 RepID=A0A438AL62_9RHOB|nr:DsbA family oxidoreductase [Mesobaculum littorinae]RVV99410.1 DsbA family oxidoreductase [Mesobaculum littorinae]